MNERNIALGNRLMEAARGCWEHADGLVDAALSLADWRPEGSPGSEILWHECGVALVEGAV